MTKREPVHMPIEQMKLALTASKGHRQLALLNELCIGPVLIETTWTQWGPNNTYGKTKLPARSFRNLRNRLKALGFYFNRGNQFLPTRHLTMGYRNTEGGA